MPSDNSEWSSLGDGEVCIVNLNNISGKLMIEKRTGFSIELDIPANTSVKITGDGSDFKINATNTSPGGLNIVKS